LVGLWIYHRSDVKIKKAMPKYSKICKKCVRMCKNVQECARKDPDQNGDKKPPFLLSELEESSIDLEEYLPENKRMIYPTQKKKLKMRFKFLETAGNESQGKSINVKFKFLATQEEQ